MKWTLINPAGTNDPDTGDIYSGFDRFGRVKDNRWYNYGSSTDVDRLQYGYDRASNRIWRRNVVAAALGKEFDELYGYDAIHRLKHMARGTLNGGRTALTSETFAQCWTLDSTGNWQGFREDDDGNGTWDLIQQRAANAVNEISGITETAGPSWVTPAYSRAGNMTTLPQPADPTASYTATYDAWNRLVKIADGADTVAEYQYDGAKRRIVQKSYTGGVLDETRHLYYTEPSRWQVVEERLGMSPDSADAERQFVWGLRYIDDLVLRARDTDDNGSLDERLYASQDATWNVTGIVDNSSDVQERYAYLAYGVPVVLSSTFVPHSAAFEWETLYCGYRWSSHNSLYHVRHRTYDSTFGSWLQRDTVDYSTLANCYAYALLSPLLYIDPSGLSVMPYNPNNPPPGSGLPPGGIFVTPKPCVGPACIIVGGGVILIWIGGTIYYWWVDDPVPPPMPQPQPRPVPNNPIPKPRIGPKPDPKPKPEPKPKPKCDEDEECDCYCISVTYPDLPPVYVGRMTPQACYASSTGPEEPDIEVCYCSSAWN